MVTEAQGNLGTHYRLITACIGDPGERFLYGSFHRAWLVSLTGETCLMTWLCIRPRSHSYCDNVVDKSLNRQE